MNFTDFCVNKDVTVRDAMKKLDTVQKKILFILDGEKILASLTDGDIRRFLLDGGELNSPSILAGNKNCRVATDLQNAKSLYHGKNFIAIPIVDKDRNLVDVYFGDEKHKSNVKLNIPVIINAGGKGTRLDPYTRVLPKPLIPIGDLPIIEHIMQKYNDFGCNEYHVIVNYKKQLIKAYFNESENANEYNISWHDEDRPLGTGGGLSLLKDKINSTFFFTNCDILLDSNYDSMLRFHRENKNAVTMICAYKNITIPYGVIEMGQNGAIKAMKEKPELSFLTNTGMYIVEPEVLSFIKPDVPVGFPDVIDAVKKAGGNVAVYPVSEHEWMDMGQMTELEQMRKRICGE